jgi:hypothetical protein
LFLPYIGDYVHMMAVGDGFCGVFSANNKPDPANFPQGVTYLRNHDFATKKLFAVNGTTEVAPSIDPFFFRYTPLQITHLTKLTLFTKLTGLTLFTKLTPLTHLTKLTLFTKFTPLTLFTPFTKFTPFTVLFTGFGPPHGPPGPIGIGAPPTAQPFIRFGNTVFAPEELELGRFEQLEGVAAELNAVGISRLHQLAASDAYALSSQLGYSREDANRLVELAQALLRGLAQ